VNRVYFASNAVALRAPTRGSGTRIEIQEAFPRSTSAFAASDRAEDLGGVHSRVCGASDALVELSAAPSRDRERRKAQRRAAPGLVEQGRGESPTRKGIDEIRRQPLTPAAGGGREN